MFLNSKPSNDSLAIVTRTTAPLRLLLNSLLMLLMFTGSIYGAAAEPQQEKEQNKANFQFTEGQHYQALPLPASKTANAVEFFSYYCPHCYRYEPVVQEINKLLPEKDVAKIHVNFLRAAPRKLQNELSKALIVAQEFNFDDAFTAAVFNRIHQQKQTFRSPQQIWDMVTAYAPPMVDVQSLRTSEQLANELKKRNQLTIKLGELGAIKGVPTLIINNRYIPNAKSVKTNKEYFALIEYLLTLTAQ